jgi:gas vesicle protein
MREGEPYIVIERERDGGFGSFVLGALVGAGLALLLAPQSGEETQEEIKKQARRFRVQAEERVRGAQEELRDAVESGRQAAREARADLERRLEQSKTAYRAGVDAARAAPRAAGSSGVPEQGAEGA